MIIDLNCDLAEGMPDDEAIMPFITSANLCCGSHAGSPGISYRGIELCQKYGLSIGAHPGYSDREHFGRRELNLEFDDLLADVLMQVQGLAALARICNTALRYIKPHGALYNQACRDPRIAILMVFVARYADLPLMALPHSLLQRASREASIERFFTEGFADRRYRADGSLVPRDQPNAFVDDPKDAVEQVEWLVETQGVDSICVHGDNPNAVEFVRVIRESLLKRGHQLKSFL